MKAVRFYAQNDIRVEEIDIPKPEVGGLLVKVEACAICGTDLKMYLKGNPRVKPPQTIGHEFVGKIVELGDAEDVFHRPLHPYTQALIRAIPATDPGRERPADLLHGDPPSPMNPPSGCPFHPRCPVAAPECATQPQPLLDIEPTRQVACWKARTP